MKLLDVLHFIVPSNAAQCGKDSGDHYDHYQGTPDPGPCRNPSVIRIIIIFLTEMYTFVGLDGTIDRTGTE